LKSAGVPVFFYYPESFNQTPCVGYYEANNAPAETADDAEYLSSVEYAIDVWGKTSSEISELMEIIDEALKRNNFTREFSNDVYDPKTWILHKTSRYSYLGG
jgi:hypothetical protein